MREFLHFIFYGEIIGFEFIEKISESFTSLLTEARNVFQSSLRA
ncbi:hypothetical protein LEP1GSC098_3941 [Leptospira interrogans serovar Grippotyphosa str. UI 08434]|nr:hypothetical protein LEP1GSC098_3941 [Leptospira interrogans serovar Grippotyphosa str. UI 08434]EMN79109.1 hypothetical protein LEP1GSC106_0259 [Leptospira interrogans serovar Grippotyphosa str. UI 12764]